MVRGWPLIVDGLLRNADATRHRFSRAGDADEPFLARVVDIIDGPGARSIVHLDVVGYPSKQSRNSATLIYCPVSAVQGYP